MLLYCVEENIMKTKVTVRGKRSRKDKVAVPLKFTVVLTNDPYEEGIFNATQGSWKLCAKTAILFRLRPA